jgi:hypothetical protein
MLSPAGSCSLSFLTGGRHKHRGKMSDEKKSKDSTPKKPITGTKVVEANSDITPKSDTSPKTETKPDATPKKQGMGEGQKPVSKAYKDNWNDIFGKKKKR